VSVINFTEVIFKETMISFWLEHASLMKNEVGAKNSDKL
jgi:hypothetical protein